MIIVNNKHKLDWYEGMTVQDVLDSMGYVLPLITVSVNGHLIQEIDYSTFEVPDNSSINVFHLAHGG